MPLVLVLQLVAWDVSLQLVAWDVSYIDNEIPYVSYTFALDDLHVLA